ncbi:MAG TPA: hypothetical protein VF649_09090 [Sphingomonas sp.]|jgi:hypothetical protein|uniref:hypothetical protein n=1 Tax=Sphingomonas sp. TaxID=28214 RepID=UPI002ED92A3C
MTTSTEAVAAIDALADQLQGHVEDGRFVPRFFERLSGWRLALAGARDRFAAREAAETEAQPGYLMIAEQAQAAMARGASLTPGDAAVAVYGAAIARVIAAIDRPMVQGGPATLRGTLRLRPAATASTRATILPQRGVPVAEPYYTSLMKLFPIEAVTLYPLAISIAGDARPLRLLLIAVIALFVIVLRWFGTQEARGGDADRGAIIVSVVSFLLYAASLGGFGYLPGGADQTTQLLAFITIMWVALVPAMLRRRSRP